MSEDAAPARPVKAVGERVISGTGARTWEVPAVGQVAGRASGPMTAGRLEAIEEEARAAGRAAGYAEGLAAGHASVVRRAELLDAVLASLAEPVARIDAQIESELMELVMAVARRLVRREIKTDPGEIVGVVREGIAALPEGDRKVTVHLHPDDARLVAEVLGGRDGAPACRIAEDPSLSRGGARISTDISVIDATLETRINRVFDRMLGGERQADEDELR